MGGTTLLWSSMGFLFAAVQPLKSSHVNMAETNLLAKMKINRRKQKFANPRLKFRPWFDWQ